MLSDPTKRQLYDQTGHTGEGAAAEQAHQGGFSQEDIFNQFRGFGRGAPHGAAGFEDILKDLFGGGDPRQAQRNEF